MALRLMNRKLEVLCDGLPPVSRPKNGPHLFTSHVHTDIDEAHTEFRLSLHRKVSSRLPPGRSHFYLHNRTGGGQGKDSPTMGDTELLIREGGKQRYRDACTLFEARRTGIDYGLG